MSDYDADILLWSERQSELLRRRATGEWVNDAELDWPNIAEEIESVGREQLHAVRSLLRQAIIPGLKVMAWPQSSPVAGWQDEELQFRQDAFDRYTRPCGSGSTSARIFAVRCNACRSRSTDLRRSHCRTSAPGSSTTC